MRAKRQPRALVILAAVTALLATTWGAEAGAAPEAPAAPDRVTQEQQTTVVQYGPYSINPAPENPDGTHGHAHSGNQFAFGVEKPCSDCYITGMTADLVDTAGNTVGVRDNLQLHHMVLFNQFDGRSDATCGLLGLLGQRFFASGDERTPIVTQPGYGYYVGGGTWNLIWDLASMSSERETVYYQVEFTWVDGDTPGMTDLEPVWFDVNQCGDSTISVPEGPSTRSWSWNANRSGNIIGIGGHVHNGGINIEIENETTGELVCDSVAGYGETPLYVDHHGNDWISSMSTCGGIDDPGFSSPVSQGDTVTINANYDQPEATSDQMGIVIAYLAQEEPDEECAWWMRLFGWC